MDFPTDVDCIVCGTGLPESIISASLSILGKRVLQIDKNDYYGGRLASLRLNDFVNAISSVDVHPEGVNKIDGSVGIVNITKPFGYPISHGKSWWCLNEECTGFTTASTPSVSLPAPVVLDDNVGAASIPNTESSIPNLYTSSDTNALPSDQITLVSNPETNMSNSAGPLWNRANLEQKLHRIDLDLLPKIIYAESPTVTALLRADVTRYLEFRFVSRLLAFTVPPSSAIEHPESEFSSDTKTPGNMTSNEPHESHMEGAHLVQIPVCRSEVFKTRLLTLRQKRSLGSFFEWCYHLPLGAAQTSSVSSSEMEVYNTYAARPLRELLSDSRNLDSFTRQLIINNLALGNDEITTKEAIQRIRQLLLSMNRFGPYPLLWPMYGCGDLPQSFCRMAAVFGAVFCLGCCLTSVKLFDAQSGDTGVPTDARNSMSQSPKFIASLSNGHEVRAQCILIGAEQAPTDWVQSHVHQWCARAVLLTDQSLLVEGRKPTDVTMLALPLSGRGEISFDPAILLEIPAEPSRVTDPELFIVHLSAAVREKMDPEQLFRPVVNRLFRKQNKSGQDLNAPRSDDHRPRCLWASYFCLPDLSTVNLTAPLGSNSVNSPFTNINGFYVVPGPDLSVHLDSTVIAAENIFRAMTSQLGIESNEQRSTTTGDSDRPSPSSLTENGAIAPEISEPAPYINLDARWDGVFPPRPPRPEDIVLPVEVEGDELADLDRT